MTCFAALIKMCVKYFIKFYKTINSIKVVFSLLIQRMLTFRVQFGHIAVPSLQIRRTERRGKEAKGGEASLS